MNSDILVVIQGSSTNVAEQKQAWKSHPILFSTWKGNESYYENSDMVIFNKPPVDCGPANFWMQQSSTMAGLKKAKEMGYDHCLKVRSDLIPTNSTAFLDCLDRNKMNFLCWHSHEVYPECSGYLVDYLMSGPIDQMIDLWDIPEAFCIVPEVLLTWNYIKRLGCFPINYFLNDLNESNDLFWLKRGVILSSYKNQPCFDFHKKFYFSTDDGNINESYLNFFKQAKSP